MEEINVFKNFWEKTPETFPLERVYEWIKNDPGLRERTLRHREGARRENKRQADREKQGCPAFTPAARFGERRVRQDLKAFTGLSLCDFDHVPAERMAEVTALARQDPHTLLAYTTISGRGLRVIFRYELPELLAQASATPRAVELYRHAFRQGNAYYAKLLGLPYDEACQNPERISGLAHDPDAHYNPGAEPFVITDCPKEATSQRAGRPAVKKVERLMATIRGTLEREGLRYEPGSHNAYIMRVGYLMNRYGVAERVATEWAERAFAGYGADRVRGILRSCYRQTDEHGTLAPPSQTAGRVPLEAVEEAIGQLVEARHNVILGQVELRRLPDGKSFRPMSDRDLNSLWSRLNKRLGPVRLDTVYNLLRSDLVPDFHPLRAYLEGLPAWDGTTDHIGLLAERVRVRGDQATFTRYFRKWFVALLPTVLEERVVNHEILVLVGRQGIYKSTWLRYLLPPELRQYFYTKTNSDRFNKDDKLTLAEFMLVCLEELDSMRPTELNQLKAMVTAPHINERAAYARNKERRPHIASFCGTGNNLRFLDDPSGSRRWLAFEVESIVNPYTTPIDYEGLYAQALALWRGGFQYWFSDEETLELARHNEPFESPNLEEELIRAYFRHPGPNETGVFLTTAQILERINVSIRKPLNPVRIGMAMGKLGFRSCRYGGQRGFVAVINDIEDIQRIMKNGALDAN